MEICGKCGREPWDGRCNLLYADEHGVKGIIAPAKNAQTKANCGHPAIGESPLIIAAAERNKKAPIKGLSKEALKYLDSLEPTNHNQSSA